VTEYALITNGCDEFEIERQRSDDESQAKSPAYFQHRISKSGITITEIIDVMLMGDPTPNKVFTPFNYPEGFVTFSYEEKHMAAQGELRWVGDDITLRFTPREPVGFINLTFEVGN
jgi:hypothetical protein